MVYLLLGSNLGDREKNLQKAVFLLQERLGILKKTEPVHTEAIGFDGPEFLNQIVAFEHSNSMQPEELLDLCQEIERKIGRPAHKVKYDTEGKRVYGSRIIDIDILMFDNLVVRTDRLILPHPQVEERPFVKDILKML